MAPAEVIQVIATHSLAHSDIERKKCVYSQVIRVTAHFWVDNIHHYVVY